MSDFVTRWRARIDQFEEGIMQKIRDTALAIHEQLVLTTPVDTGRARSNWLVTIQNPTNLVVEPRSVTAALSGAAIAVREVNSTEDQVFISNNVSYLIGLNMGNSRQAPAGFVEIAVARGQAHSSLRRIFG